MPIKVKVGMKGSRAGRGRVEKTAELKSYSKTVRRRQVRKAFTEQLHGA